MTKQIMSVKTLFNINHFVHKKFQKIQQAEDIIAEKEPNPAWKRSKIYNKLGAANMSDAKR